MAEMDLNDIIKSFEGMTYEERMQKLQEIRGDRQISKVAQTARKAKGVTKKKKAKSLIDSMSDEEKLALIKKLQEAG